MIQYARVQFLTSPTIGGRRSNLYSYKCVADVKVGDKVLVETSGSQSGYDIAEVVVVTPVYDPRATKWIVQKVDFEQFEKAKADERRAKDLQKFLKQKLVAKMAKDQFTVLAAEDEEVAKAIAELESISGPAAFNAVVNVKYREVEQDDETPDF